MDIKAKIGELVDKIKSDEGLRNKFMSDPVKAIEELLGVTFPSEVPTEEMVVLPEPVKDAVLPERPRRDGHRPGGRSGSPRRSSRRR